MAVSAARDGLPAAVRAGMARMAIGDIHFAPVRHHSPACAIALRAMIRELRPAAVLIEGPDEFDALIPLLLDERTRPPVAVLCQLQAPPGSGDVDAPPVRSSFFPFCDYSPEWVALHEAHAAGAQVAFIDRPWRLMQDGEAGGDQDQDDDSASDEARSLMSERYLAHSEYLRALSRSSGCRDQDELWDQLFELRTPVGLRDWRVLFSDVFCYCAMARNDYELQVLEADGSLPRERHMARHILEWRARVDGPIVVVTGGFHTIALQDLVLAPTPAANAVKPASPATHLGNWLIRYSFDQLDALNGYAAGMPSPAFHQAVWESACTGDHGPDMHAITARALSKMAIDTRALGVTDPVSTADVRAATLQAFRLAELRGHAGPGRYDLLDAIRSCYVKGDVEDGTRGMAGDVLRYLGGSQLGDIPPSAGSPPLLEDARRAARAAGVRLDDSTPRTAALDLYRKEGHRARSRFLHLMAYLETGLARWQSGPDFMAGVSLDLIIEQWQVGWNPMVESRLIELAPLGASLLDVAMARLRKEEAAINAQGASRSAAHAAGLLTRACVTGLHARLPALLQMLATHLDEDNHPASVIACGHKLLVLYRGREPLGLQDNPHLLSLMGRARDNALYLMPGLAGASAQDERNAIDALLSMRALDTALRDRTPLDDHTGPASWQLQLERIAGELHAPGVASAASALLFIDGHWSEEQFTHKLAARFGPGAQADDAVRALQGVMAAAPELLVTQTALRNDISAIFAGWDEQTFLAFLPDLRRAFAQLKPMETARIAETLGHLTGDDGIDHSSLDHVHVSEADMLAGAALQAALMDSLARDGLMRWASMDLEGA